MYEFPLSKPLSSLNHVLPPLKPTILHLFFFFLFCVCYRRSCATMSLFLAIFIIFHLLHSTKGQTDDDFFKICPPIKCGDEGPLIRFPFRLDSQPRSCSLNTTLLKYPWDYYGDGDGVGDGYGVGYELSCSGNTTLLNLPWSGNFTVTAIDYLRGTITIKGGDSWSKCPLQGYCSLNFTNSIITPSLRVFSLVGCPRDISWNIPNEIVGPISCLNNDPNQSIYAVSDYVTIDEMPDVCTKISDFHGFPYFFMGIEHHFDCTFACAIDKLMATREVKLEYFTPSDCYRCEENGDFCGWNQTTDTVACFQYYQRSHSHIPLIAGTSVGAILILFSILFVIIYITKRSEKEKELRLKIEGFLAGYNTTKLTRYTLTDLKKITKKYKHRLGQGGFGSVYKGELPNEIPVAVKLLEISTTNGDEFINEVATIGRIHHFNIVRLLGFCSEGAHRALVYEFMPNESLEKYIFFKENRTGHRKLSFKKLHDIAFGVARGIEYLHQGCNQRILHFDIKPHNILLNHNFSPKISDFGLAKLCSKDQSMVTMTAMRGTMGYIAPEVYSRSFGMVSYKSDVYSFGMLLLEMVAGKRNIDPTVENASEVYFPEWAYDKLVRGEDLEEVVEVGGNDAEIAKKLVIVALWCVQCNPADRPCMSRVINMLEGDLRSLSMPPNPFA